MANLSADELRSKFTAFAEAAGVEKLGKPAFISLVQALISQVNSMISQCERLLIRQAARAAMSGSHYQCSCARWSSAR